MAWHRAVDGPCGCDEAGRHTNIGCSLNHVVGVNGDAVTADTNTGGVSVEVPLGGGCGEHIFDVDIQSGEDSSQFVDQSDVDVALNVFDDLGSLGDFEFADVADVFSWSIWNTIERVSRQFLDSNSRSRGRLGAHRGQHRQD